MPAFRPYVSCRGVGCNSWLFADRVHKFEKCTHCGESWHHSAKEAGWLVKGHDKSRKRVQWADWNFERRGHVWPRSRTYKQALLCNPPGLPKAFAKKEAEKHDFVQWIWASLDEGAKQAAKEKGYNFDPAPMPPKTVDLELLKTHLDRLPDEVKEHAQGIVEPTKTPAEQGRECSRAFKDASGNLRSLAERKIQLQGRIDNVKESLRTLLLEMQTLTEEIKSAESEAQRSQEALAKQMLHDTQAPHDGVSGLLAQLGIDLTDEQKDKLAELACQPRKRSRLQACDSSDGFMDWQADDVAPLFG